MATANPPVRDHEDNYEIELSRIREKIRTQFSDLTNRLKCRERELLEELDIVLASYRSYRDEFEILRDKVRHLEMMKQRNEEELATSPSKEIQENIIRQIEEEIKSITYPKQPQLVTFVCESGIIFSEIDKVGKLVNNGTSRNERLIEGSLREEINNQSSNNPNSSSNVQRSSDTNPTPSDIFHFTDFMSFGVYHDFSTFSNHGFHLDGEYWNSVQHYYQARKYFPVKWLMDYIKSAITSKDANEIGKDKVNTKVSWNPINSTKFILLCSISRKTGIIFENK